MTRVLFLLMAAVLMAASCGEGAGSDGGRGAGGAQAPDSVPLLIREVRKCSRLYTSEYNIRKIVTYSDEPRLRGRVLGHGVDVRLPVGDRKIAIPISVTLKAYIDLGGFSESNVSRDGRHITVTLPNPQVALTSSKVDQRGIREYVALTRGRFSDAEMAEFERQGRQAVLNSIPRLDIRETARLNAARLLIPMIMRMGYREEDITIVVKDEETVVRNVD